MSEVAPSRSASAAAAAAVGALERIQPATNACVTILGEDALARAAAVDPAAAGPLAGTPYAVKDAFDLAGVPSDRCSRGFRPRAPAADAAVVRRLAAHGAVAVAKANQHELATGATNLVSAAGPTANPWDPERMTGGSSGGSAAAVAAGAVRFALGTDAGGSVRIPAALCGVTGLKPTHGTVSLAGVMRTAPSLDVAGPIAVTAADCLAVLRAIRDTDPPPQQAGPLRIGLPRPYFELLQDGVGDAVEGAAATLQSLGHAVEWVEGPDPEDGVTALHVIAPVEIAHERRDLDDPEALDPTLVALMEAARGIPAIDYLAALDAAAALRERYRRVFERVDLLLTPATPYVAPRAAEVEVEVAGGTLDTLSAPARLTNGVNVAGLPAIAFPAGFGEGGMPVGAQLIGPWGADELLCETVVAFQAVTDHHDRPPAS